VQTEVHVARISFVLTKFGHERQAAPGCGGDLLAGELGKCVVVGGGQGWVGGQRDLVLARTGFGEHRLDVDTCAAEISAQCGQKRQPARGCQVWAPAVPSPRGAYRLGLDVGIHALDSGGDALDEFFEFDVGRNKGRCQQGLVSGEPVAGGLG
jgi:hypothetical protein